MKPNFTTILKLKRIKLKFFIFLLVFFISSAGVGISYANSNGSLQQTEQAEVYCDVKFICVDAYDNENVKFIGEVTAERSSDWKSIIVTISHAYPTYEVYIDFTIKNTGDMPITYLGVVLEDYDASAMDIDVSWTNWMDIIPVGGVMEGTMKLTVLNTVQQNSEYPFTIGFGFMNEDCCNGDCDPIGTLDSMFLPLFDVFKNLF